MKNSNNHSPKNKVESRTDIDILLKFGSHVLNYIIFYLKKYLNFIFKIFKMAARQKTKRFRTYVYWNFSSNFDVGNHALKSWSTFSKHPVYMAFILTRSEIFISHLEIIIFKNKSKERKIVYNAILQGYGLNNFLLRILRSLNINLNLKNTYINWNQSMK